MRLESHRQVRQPPPAHRRPPARPRRLNGCCSSFVDSRQLFAAGFEDYKELKCVHKPHAPPGATSTSEAAHGTSSSSSGNTAAGGPPTLARSSAPPPIHGAAAVHRYLSRSSSGSAPSSPRAAPGSPRSTGAQGVSRPYLGTPCSLQPPGSHTGAPRSPPTLGLQRPSAAC